MVEVLILGGISGTCVAAFGYIVRRFWKAGKKELDALKESQDTCLKLLTQSADRESKVFESLVIIAKDSDKIASSTAKYAELLEAALRPPQWNIKEVPAEVDSDALALRRSIITRI